MIITVIGSSKFKDLILENAKALTLNGHIVFVPCVFPHSGDEISEEQHIAIGNTVRQEISMSDGVLVINPDNYIGASTYGYIDWAIKNNKQISFLETPPELVAEETTEEELQEQE